jgi:SAM-dependent methyltransferase
MSEVDLVRNRYARREKADLASLYDPLDPAVMMSEQEMEAVLIRCIRTCGLAPVHSRRVLEIGCGAGSNLLRLLQLGFLPENLVGNEVLEDRALKARHRLPEATRMLVGDAAAISLEEGPFDIVYQSTVFTSLLDEAFRRKLADRMWALTKPGGGILWYDFIYDNPNNADVRGIPVRRIQELFPQGQIHVWRLTLAPPISRRLAKIHPGLYRLFNALPFLRTHVLCWIQK